MAGIDMLLDDLLGSMVGVGHRHPGRAGFCVCIGNQGHDLILDPSFNRGIVPAASNPISIDQSLFLPIWGDQYSVDAYDAFSDFLKVIFHLIFLFIGQ